ncbi:MAG: hypothetical protein QOJ42_151 [Acidobacteriaceae bacterium]|nr:hypothetical protein [Acidobacteriaceae bacterium]
MLTRCLFCDRQSKAKAAHFLGTQERLKEHIADGIRYVMAIVFHSNADGTVIVPECNFNPFRRKTGLQCLARVEQQIIDSRPQVFDYRSGPG